MHRTSRSDVILAVRGKAWWRKLYTIAACIILCCYLEYSALTGQRLFVHKPISLIIALNCVNAITETGIEIMKLVRDTVHTCLIFKLVSPSRFEVSM